VSSPSAGRRRHLPNSPFNAAREAAAIPPQPIPVGTRVAHERYGLGRVVAVEDQRAVIVDFGGGEVRRVALDSTKLETL
jgi:hypothetical protein